MISLVSNCVLLKIALACELVTLRRDSLFTAIRKSPWEIRWSLYMAPFLESDLIIIPLAPPSAISKVNPKFKSCLLKKNFKKSLINLPKESFPFFILIVLSKAVGKTIEGCLWWENGVGDIEGLISNGVELYESLKTILLLPERLGDAEMLKGSIGTEESDSDLEQGFKSIDDVTDSWRSTPFS